MERRPVLLQTGKIYMVVSRGKLGFRRTIQCKRSPLSVPNTHVIQWRSAASEQSSASRSRVLASVRASHVSSRVICECSRVRLRDTITPEVLIDTYKQVLVNTRAGGNARQCEWKCTRVQVDTHASVSGNAHECKRKHARVQTRASRTSVEAESCINVC